MSLRLLIPVRPLHDGKRRLASALSPQEREALNGWFFRNTVQLALSVLPAAQCIVVSRAPELLSWAASNGLQAIEETPRASGLCNLNAALEQAAALAKQQGASSVLSLSCDLPYLTREDLSALIGSYAPGRVSIASDQSGTGTNALLMPVGAIAYRYGIGSFEAHTSAARSRGLDVLCVNRHGIACDIDTPQDLADWRRLRQSAA